MERKTASQFDQEVLDLYDDYAHGRVDRRDFLQRASKFAIGGLNEGWPAYETALKEAGVRYIAHLYDGVNHGYHNDTTPRYDEAAAKLAWTRTMEFFKKTLLAG